MTRPPGRPRSQASRERILAATRELLPGGVDRLSMDGIAARAGVGKQTLYRWWPSKSAIIAEAVIEGFEPPSPATVVHTGDRDADIAGWIDRSALALSDPDVVASLRAALSAIAGDDDAAARFAERTLGPARRAVAELLQGDGGVDAAGNGSGAGAAGPGRGAGAAAARGADAAGGVADGSVRAGGAADGSVRADAAADLAISALLFQVLVGRDFDAAHRDALRAMLAGIDAS
ncbi:TetR/AcrR family transcriptional regulator [Agromyces archimandritae]|uniref:TetR/AcrR family transcriptional regulator n=1 Tax=Agromyces archimandritae TaxID=2781962 RepID=UPI001FD47453|nr:TetR/AcrR family transcriptional regulator [Agromyces archimandritae]